MSEKKRVVVTVAGGVATVFKNDPDIEVIILDYDVDDVDEERLSVDYEGERCVVISREDELDPKLVEAMFQCKPLSDAT